MNRANFTLVGSDNLIRVLREFPEEGFRKPVMAGFRKAAVPVKKAMVDSVPDRIKSVKAAIKVKQSRRGLVMDIGFRAKAGVYRNSRGKDWDPYQLAYWFNYGTYANRSPFHEFKKARGRLSNTRKGGIRPDLFVEGAVENSLPQAAAELEKEWALQIQKLCDKYGVTK